MSKLFCLLAVVYAFAAQAEQASLHNSNNRDSSVYLKDLQIVLPAGWTLHQDAVSGDTTLVGLVNGDSYISLYAKPKTGLALANMYGPQAQVSPSDTTENIGALAWHSKDSQRAPQTRDGATIYVHGFLTELNGTSYYGFSRASSADAAKQNATTVLSGIMTPMMMRSLTDANYTGKKYYFGWGAGGHVSDEMTNEVKYDVKHTNDIFTKDIGGNYLPTTVFEDQASGSYIKNTWRTISGKMTKDDMYVQYSSGHGYQGGLAVGLTYEDIRDTLLAMPAREIIVLTMACFSGGLVDSFNQSKSQWADWQNQRRTLFVLASSQASEESSTGPGTDPGEPNGPDGSAGSAFGFSLWKALSGEADGYVDGVKDGFISLAEIRDYTTAKTKQVGSHTPAVTGAYNGNLIMNKIPSAAFLASLTKEGGTTGMTDAQIMLAIEKLDQEMRVH